jgi:putative tryptophan/tyrosine transport system substrate-binding protein
MHRRAFVQAGVLVLAQPFAARAQSANKIRRIGDLSLGAPETAEEIRQGYAPLGKLGWVEGQNLLVERRYANNRPELLRPLAEELVRLKVDLIVTSGTAAALAAKNATTSIPIVFGVVSDPVGVGLVASLPRPGGNITGFSIVNTELNKKRLAVLRELVPAVERVGILENQTNPYFRAAHNELEQASRSIGIRPVFVEVAAASELAGAVSEAVRRGAQALLVSPDVLFYEHRVEIMRAALKHSLPTASSRSFVEAGGLVAYTSSLSEQSDRLAAFIDRILRGAKPADLPVEQPTKFDLLINLKTAKTLGITVPEKLLLRADEVIK